MNYLDGDYVMGHLLTQANKTKMDTLLVDILNNTAEPADLLTSPVISSIRSHNKFFPALVNNGGSSLAFIRSATMVIRFDLARAKPHSWLVGSVESPFRCEVVIQDDQGKEYRSIHEGWWYPEIG